MQPAQEQPISGRPKASTALIVLFLAGVLVYSNTFLSPFTFDDASNIVNNSHLTNIWNLRAIWNFWPSRFITYLSLALNYSIHQLNLLGYHLFNLAVHLGASFLLYWLTRLTFSTPAMKEQKISEHARLIAFLVSLLFIVHPVQVQGVTYIIQRATSLAAFFYLASLGLYVKSRLLEGEASRKGLYYRLSLVSAVMAMFSKEWAISLPLAILLYEYSFLKSEKRFNWKYAIPFLVTLLIIPLTMFLTKSVNFGEMRRAVESGPAISPLDYLLTQFRVMVTYIRLLFLPFNQNVDYDYPVAKTLFDLPVLASLLFLAGIIFTAIKLFRNYRLLSWGIFFFFLVLLPESSIIPIRDVIFEHRLYLPMAGFCLFLVSAMYYLTGKKNLKTFSLVIIILAIFYAALTYARNSVWKDEFSLWSDAARKSPRKARPHLNLGNTYKNKGDSDQAFVHYNMAIEFDPRYALAYYNRGVLYQNKDNFDQALVDYNKAIEISPNYVDAYSNRGLVYENKGNFEQALSDYNKAMQINPSSEVIYYNRGLAYQNKGELDQAIAEFSKAIKINPNRADVYNNRGLVYQNKGELEQAMSDYNRAIQINPDLEISYYNRANLYKNEGHPDQAMADYSQVIKINPNYADAYNNRGNLYRSKGELDQAMTDYSRAIEINPKYANAYNNRGTLYAEKNSLNQALGDCNKAIEINPNYAEAYLNRAVIYLEARRYDESWDDLHKAEALGYQVNPEFVALLKQASKREK